MVKGVWLSRMITPYGLGRMVTYGYAVWFRLYGLGRMVKPYGLGRMVMYGYAIWFRPYGYAVWFRPYD